MTYLKSILPRWTPSGTATSRTADDDTTVKDRWQRIFLPGRPPGCVQVVPGAAASASSPHGCAEGATRRTADARRRCIEYRTGCRQRQASPRGTRQPQLVDPALDRHARSSPAAPIRSAGGPIESAGGGTTAGRDPPGTGFDGTLQGTNARPEKLASSRKRVLRGVGVTSTPPTRRRSSTPTAGRSPRRGPANRDVPRPRTRSCRRS